MRRPTVLRIGTTPSPRWHVKSRPPSPPLNRSRDDAAADRGAYAVLRRWHALHCGFEPGFEPYFFGGGWSLSIPGRRKCSCRSAYFSRAGILPERLSACCHAAELTRTARVLFLREQLHSRRFWQNSQARSTDSHRCCLANFGTVCTGAALYYASGDAVVLWIRSADQQKSSLNSSPPSRSSA